MKIMGEGSDVGTGMCDLEPCLQYLSVCDMIPRTIAINIAHNVKTKVKTLQCLITCSLSCSRVPISDLLFAVILYDVEIKTFI